MSKLHKNKKVKPFKQTQTEEHKFDYDAIVQQTSKTSKMLLGLEGKRLAQNGQTVATHAAFGPEGSNEQTYETIILNDDGSIFEQAQYEKNNEKYNGYYFIFADGMYASARTDDKAENLDAMVVVEDRDGNFKEIHYSMLPIENSPITLDQIVKAIMSFDKPALENKNQSSGPVNG